MTVLEELQLKLQEDDTLMNVDSKDIQCKGEAWQYGYGALICKYKGQPVMLWDASNGHYEYGHPVSWLHYFLNPLLNKIAYLVYLVQLPVVANTDVGWK